MLYTSISKRFSGESLVSEKRKKCSYAGPISTIDLRHLLPPFYQREVAGIRNIQYLIRSINFTNLLQWY